MFLKIDSNLSQDMTKPKELSPTSAMNVDVFENEKVQCKETSDEMEIVTVTSPLETQKMPLSDPNSPESSLNELQIQEFLNRNDNILSFDSSYWETSTTDSLDIALLDFYCNSMTEEELDKNQEKLIVRRGILNLCDMNDSIFSGEESEQTPATSSEAKENRHRELEQSELCPKGQEDHVRDKDPGGTHPPLTKKEERHPNKTLRTSHSIKE